MKFRGRCDFNHRFQHIGDSPGDQLRFAKRCRTGPPSSWPTCGVNEMASWPITTCAAPGHRRGPAERALVHIIIAEIFLMWTLSRSTEGFEKLKEKVAEYTPERVSEITGVAVRPSRRPRVATAAAESGHLYTMGLPSIPPGRTTSSPWPTWPCSPATWASLRPGEFRCAARTTSRSLRHGSPCPTSIPATRRWAIRRFRRNSPRPGECR